MIERNPLWLENHVTLPDGVVQNSPSVAADSSSTTDLQQEETATQETVEGSVQVSPDGTEDVSSPLPFSLSQGIFLLIALAAGVAALAIGLVLWRRRRRTAPLEEAHAAPAPSGTPVPQVGKLHAQGKRDSQQDCFSVSAPELWNSHGLLAVVADGMGGLKDGDQVSQTAVQAMINSFYDLQGEPASLLLTLLERANQAVNDLLGPEGRNKSGSTLVAGLIRDEQFYFLSVGDSRICLYRNGNLLPLNREHVLRQDLLVQAVNGEQSLQEAAAHPSAGGLTSFLGMGRLRQVDLPSQPVSIQPGDRFLLMSDGVYNALSSQELAELLDQDPQQAAQAIGQAIEAKGYANQDNYTAVILGC